MPLGINNPLVKRMKGHASMSVLFRTVEPSSERLVPRGQLPYVPPIVSAGAIPPEGELEAPPEVLSPMDQALQAAEKITPVAPTTRAPSPQQAAAPVAPTPTVQMQSEQLPAEQPASLAKSKEDQDWDGSWGRLKNIFQRQQEKKASEEPPEKSEQAEPATLVPEQSRTIAEVRRSLSEPEEEGPIKRRRSKVEYIKPEESAKPIEVSPFKPPESKSLEEPESAEVGLAQDIEGTSSPAPEIQAERQPDQLDMVSTEKADSVETTATDVSDIKQPGKKPEVSVQREPELPSIVSTEKAESAETTAADVSDLEQPGIKPEVSVQREPELPDIVSTEKADSAETTAADVSAIEQPGIKPEVSVQRELEKTGQPPVLDAVEKSVAPIDEAKHEIEEPKKKEVTQTAAAAELPEPKEKLDRPTPTVGTDLDKDLTVQRSDAPPAVTKHVPEALPTSEFETSLPEPEALPTSGIKPPPESAPSQPPEKDEGIGQRLLGAARRFLGSESRAQKQEPAQEQSLPVEVSSGSPETVQKISESEPVSAEDIKTGHALPEDVDQLEPEDEVATAIAQAKRPAEQSSLQPAVSEQEASARLSAPPSESTQQTSLVQREVDESGKMAETAESESEIAQSPPAPEQSLAERVTQEGGEDLGPVVQALPATDTVDINREAEARPTPDIQTEAEPVSHQIEADSFTETPVTKEESRQLDTLGDAEETVIMPSPAIEKELGTRAMSLEQAWPVHSVKPNDTAAPSPEPKTSTPSAEPVVQRRPAGGDESASQVEEALRQVQPSETSDSAVELVTPRRPRPIISRSPRPQSTKPVTEQPAPESPAPAETSLQTTVQMPDSASTADTTSVQRQIEEAEEGEDLPAQPTGTTRAPPAGTTMVPTEIGDLPSDFWDILGQKPPEAAHPVHTTIPTNGGLQRTPASTGDVSAAISYAEAPTYERPPLETFIQREWSAPAVQRAEPTDLRSSRGVVSDQSSAEISPEAQETEKSSGGEVDINKLAEAVYRQLKRRLSVERERGRGRF